MINQKLPKLSSDCFKCFKNLHILPLNIYNPFVGGSIKWHLIYNTPNKQRSWINNTLFINILQHITSKLRFLKFLLAESTTTTSNKKTFCKGSNDKSLVLWTKISNLIAKVYIFLNSLGTHQRNSKSQRTFIYASCLSRIILSSVTT